MAEATDAELAGAARDGANGADRDTGNAGHGANGTVLVSFTAVTNLADGVLKVALPIAATQLTRSPSQVAGVALMLSLPWLVTALHVGVLVDRADRRRLIEIAGVLRVAAVAALLAFVLADGLTLAMLYVAGAVLGIAEVIAMTAGAALIPAAVPRSRLERTNAWVTGAETVCNEFAGPSVGGLLVGLGLAIAFEATAAAYILGILLIALLAGRFRAPGNRTARSSVNADIAAGLRCLWRQPLLRTMNLMIAMMAGCWSAWLAILPIYAIGPGPMGLSADAYGLMLSALGLGGIVGAMSATAINRLFGRRWTMFGDLIGTFAMMLAPAVTTSVWLVGAAAFVGGMGGTLWTVNSRTISQLIVPAELMGRYSAAARLLGWGTMPLGAAIAGGIAEFFGLRVAFAVGAVGMALLTIPFFRNITPAALAAATEPADTGGGGPDPAGACLVELRRGGALS